jgi:hypothetical protein
VRREDAIAELAKRRLAALTDEERAKRLGCIQREDWTGAPEWDRLDDGVRSELQEDELTLPASSARYDPVLLMWLNSGYAALTNAYLREELGVAEVVGEPKMLEPCACCGRRTLGELSAYDICTVCWWEDDGQDNDRADVVMGGPNALLSLTQARVNYLRHGISDGKPNDLRVRQSPARMFESGRQFVLTDDGVSEIGTDWRSQRFDLE